MTADARRDQIREFLLSKAEIERKRAAQRRESAATWRSTSESGWQDAHQLAEQMGGRRLPYLSASERARSAEADDRIASKHDAEAAEWEAAAEELYRLSRVEAERDALRDMRRACSCQQPDPVMQADGKFYCHTCSFQTGARPAMLQPEALLREKVVTEATLARVEAALRAIADRKICEDDPDACTQDSGPYCGTHVYDSDIVQEARQALANLSPVKMETQG